MKDDFAQDAVIAIEQLSIMPEHRSDVYQSVLINAVKGLWANTVATLGSSAPPCPLPYRDNCCSLDFRAQAIANRFSRALAEQTTNEQLFSLIHFAQLSGIDLGSASEAPPPPSLPKALINLCHKEGVDFERLSAYDTTGGYFLPVIADEMQRALPQSSSAHEFIQHLRSSLKMNCKAGLLQWVLIVIGQP